MKQGKILALSVAAAAVISGACCFGSYASLGTANAVAAAKGLCTVLFTDAEYAVIQDSPQIVLAKPDASLEEYMQAAGYRHEPYRQLGSLHSFSAGTDSETVAYAQNRYFSTWTWQE